MTAASGKSDYLRECLNRCQDESKTEKLFQHMEIFYINLNTVPVFVDFTFNAHFCFRRNGLPHPALVVYINIYRATGIAELVELMSDLFDDITFKSDPGIITKRFSLCN